MSSPAPARARVTDMLAHIVESIGAEVSVTLLLQGSVAYGLLTPIRRFYLDLERLHALVTVAGEGPFDRETHPMTAKEIAEVRDGWEQDHPGGEFQNAETFTYPQVCLREAVVYSSAPESWRRCAYLLVNADEIGGMAVGYPCERTNDER